MADFKSARRKATNNICEMMDKLENTTNGFNATSTREYLNSLSDKAFKEFMTRLANEEWFNLQFQMNMLDKKHKPDLQRIKSIAKYYNIPLMEYIRLPFKSPDDPENAPYSMGAVPVMYCVVRPLQQMLDKKSAYASGRDSVNTLTGQVSGKDKASTLSNMQTIALTTQNNTEIVKELLGPRADDEESKARMLRQISETGEFDVNSIPIRTKDKQSLETIRVMLIGAGLRVAFGKDKLSYTLPLV